MKQFNKRGEKVDKDDILILYRFHATGALGTVGKIEIIIDPPPDDPDTIDEWSEQDAERLRVMLLGYFPDATIDKLKGMILKRLTTKQIVKELERRT